MRYVILLVVLLAAILGYHVYEQKIIYAFNRHIITDTIPVDTANPLGYLLPIDIQSDGVDVSPKPTLVDSIKISK